ncbi:Dot/Icm T4SS effector Wip [Legionella spiritensis]|uniref:Dot/Icm T4SS effector Wip n=1 Tax=Legionella spiritensis TaxID=452 RepID=UPI000F6EE1F0|nr:Dot/Icm T4SS effector Wip [Legionella spiritensis]VEG90919.1 Dot/Icm secretion system substrate [Legionella spiritensis]
MSNRLINKNIDIYSYPDFLEGHSGSLTLGDLHGNTVKLLHFLFRHRIIRFKKEIANVRDAYQRFVFIYEQYGDIIEQYQENRTLLQFAQIKKANIKEKLAGIEKQLSLGVTPDRPQYQSLIHRYQQATADLQTALENEKNLQGKLLEPKDKLLHLVAQFHQFIDSLEIHDHKALIRLLGDEVSDRGFCDYFTLKILDFLHQNQIKKHDTISNHGCEFIYAYEKFLQGDEWKPMGNIPDFQITSFWGLKILLEQGIVTVNELNQLIDGYKSDLKIIDYTISEEGITLFSHAPIRLDTIQLLASRLGVVYDDATKEGLAETIEQINNQFQSYINNNIIHTLFHNDQIADKTNMSEEERAAYPLIYLIWNRWNQDKETSDARPQCHNGYTVTYVHGHDSFQSRLPHVHNLDTLCGKEARKTEEKKINNVFQFLKENRYKEVDKRDAEFYLRNVLRYKVLDSDEFGLQAQYRADAKSGNTPPARDCNGSLKQLSRLGKPVGEQDITALDHTVQTTTVRPCHETTSHAEDKGVYKAIPGITLPRAFK